MRIWCGPMIFDAQSIPCIPHWRAPHEARAWIEVRGGEKPEIVFTTDNGVRVPDYVLLGEGEWNSIKADDRMRDAVPHRTGFRPDGDTLAQLIANAVCDGADPSGHEFCKPFEFSARSLLRLGDMNHEWFPKRFGRHWNVSADVVRNDVARMFRRNGNASRRYVSSKSRAFGGDWNRFVSRDIAADFRAPLEPHTAYSDNFDGADDAALGKQLTWTEVGGTGEWSNTGNRAYKLKSGTATNDRIARADHDLSDDDMRTIASVVVLTAPATGFNDDSVQGGVTARHDDVDETYYATFLDAQKDGDRLHYLFRVEAGTFTSMATASAYTLSLPHVLQLRTAATIDAYRDGTLIHSVSNSAITGNVRGGLYALCSNSGSSSGDVQFDDFTAEDISVGRGLLYSRMLSRVSLVG